MSKDSGTDNTTTHMEWKVLAVIAEQLGALRWVWMVQPATSLLANTTDAFISPAQTKLVLAYQGLLSGGRYLQCENLWKIVKKA